MSLNGSMHQELTTALCAAQQIDAANAAVTARPEPIIPGHKLKRSGSRLDALRGSTELKFLQDAGEAVKTSPSVNKK
jgi:hypothetical protein